MSGLFNDDTLSLYLKLKEAMKQYLSDAFGGSLNAEVPNYPQMIANQAKAQQNTLRDAWGDPNKMADATLGMMNGAMGSFLPFGITAWHGSPHKFDKFDLSKIGTGEGAQAYGHGSYLAEAPGVAKQYADTLSSYHIATKDGVKGGGDFADALVANAGEYPSSLSSAIRSQANKIATDLANGKPAEQIVSAMRNGPYARIYSGLADAVENLSPSKAVGSLYKVDIPDEAVARFLDWDKPLSEQAKEVQAALAKTKNKQLRAMVDYANVPHSEAIGGEAKTMGEAFRLLNLNLHGKSSADSVKASALLAKQGIPGIRYLDGGSRGAGTGTSNYVVFDPEMIRILERNGVATGAKPWQPGEWEGLFKK